MVETSGLVLLILISFFLRLFLLPLPSFPIDMTDWIAWAEHLLRVGPGQFYSTIWSDYLPGYLYVLWVLATVHQLLPQIPYEALMKLPAIFADLSVGWLIFQITKEVKSPKFAILVASLFVFNPFVFFNSSIWGQIDSFFSLLLFLSIYLLIKRRENLSFIFLAASFSIKPQIIFFLPLFFLYLLKEKRLKRFYPLLFLFFATIFVISWPFFPNDPIFGLPKLILKSASTYPYTSVFAMNFWGIFGTWKPDSTIFLNLSYQTWGMVFLGLGLILTWISFWKNIGSGHPFYLSSSLIVLAFFMLPTRVHERWLYPFFPFFLILAARLNNWKFWLIYASLSVINFLNLYFVYTYYNPNFLTIGEASDFIGRNFSWFSLVSVVIYLWLLFLSFKSKEVNEKT